MTISIISHSANDKLGHKKFIKEILNKFENQSAIFNHYDSSLNTHKFLQKGIPFNPKTKVPVFRKYANFAVRILNNISILAHSNCKNYIFLEESIESCLITEMILKIRTIIFNRKRTKRIYIIHSFKWTSQKRSLYKKLITKLTSYLNNEVTLGTPGKILSTRVSKLLINHKFKLQHFGYSLKGASETINGNREFSENERIDILIFGIIRKDKGIATTVRKIIPTLDKQTFVTIAGFGSQELESEIKEAIGNDNRIKLLNKTFSEQEVNTLYVKTNACIICCADEFFSMSGPLCLAIEYGKPCIISSNSWIKDLAINIKFGNKLNTSDPIRNQLNNIIRSFKKTEMLKSLNYSEMIKETLNYFS